MADNFNTLDRAIGYLLSGQVIEQKAFVSGRYYYLPNYAGTSNSIVLGVGTLRATPFWVPAAATLDRIGAEIVVIGDAGSKVRLGLYTDDGTGRPDALVLDAGTIAADSATVQEIVISQALSRGVYWAAGVVQVVTVNQPTVRVHGAAGVVPVDMRTATPGAGVATMGMLVTGVTGALPATFGATAVAGAVPRIFARIA